MEGYQYQNGGEETTPVTFKTLESLPEYLNIISPTGVLYLRYSTIEYYKPALAASGYYKLFSNESSGHPVILYQTHMKQLVAKLDHAFKMAKNLEENVNLHDDSSTFLVDKINDYGTVTNRLVLNTSNGEVFIYLKSFGINKDNEVYPTKRSVRFSREDDLKAMSDFIRGKK